MPTLAPNIADRAVWIEDNLEVQPKIGGIVPLRLTQVQRRILKEVGEQYNAGKPVRVIIVKPRQMMATTVTQALFFSELFHRDNLNALVIANSDDVAENILSMSRRFYDHLPREERRDGPKREHCTKKMFDFEHPHNSRQVVTTAKRGDVGGKSYTFQLVHVSEAADFDTVAEPETLWATVSATIPDKPGTMVVIESTASGQDTFFYPRAKRAFEGRDPDWKCIFVAWFEVADYTMKVPENFSLTPEEGLIKKTFKLADGQMAWRRKTIRDKCNGNVVLFQRYYPATFAEAFRASSLSLFNNNHCENQIEKHKAAQPIRKGEFWMEEVGPQWGFKRSHDEAVGRWKIWADPVQDKEYIIGADPSRWSSGGDSAAAFVLRKDNFEVVASFHGWIENHVLAKQCWAAGMTYNEALLVPENNIEALAQHLDVVLRYRNLFFYTLESRSRYMRPGINMNKKTRTTAIDKLHRIHDLSLKCRDVEFWKELIHFKAASYTRVTANLNNKTIRTTVSQKFAAESGRYADNRVMAMCCSIFPLTDGELIKVKDKPEETPAQEANRIINERIKARKEQRADTWKPRGRMRFGTFEIR